MVRVSSPAKLRPWSELTAQNGDGGGSWVGEFPFRKTGFEGDTKRKPHFRAHLILPEKFSLPECFYVLSAPK